MSIHFLGGLEQMDKEFSGKWIGDVHIPPYGAHLE